MGRQTFKDEQDYEVDVTSYRYKQAVTEVYDEETWQELRQGLISGDELQAMNDRVQDYLDMQTAELQSIATVFTTADRILLNDGGAKVQLYKPTPADEGAYDGVAGWSDGRVIMLNADIVKILSEDDVVALNGLNYHELSHALYTPRAGSELVKWVVDNKVQRSMNYLEDMRIETLFTARFPSTRAFLEGNFYNYVATNGVDDNIFLLTRGRKYIPLEIRQAIADAFIARHGLDMATRVADIIDEYRSLIFPQDSERAKQLIVKFADIVGRGNNPEGQNGGGGGEGGEGEGSDDTTATDSSDSSADDSNNKSSSQNINCKFGCGKRDAMKAGRMLGKNEQTKDQSRVKDFDRNDKSEQLGNKSDNGGGNGERNDAHTYQDTLDDNKLEQDTSKINEAIKELIEKRAKEINNDDQVRREVRNFTDAVESNDSFMGSLRQARYQEQTVYIGDEHDESAQRFGRELEQLQIEAEQTWLREQSSGRLNVDRAMHADINAIDRVFDRWQEADYSTEIEAVILLDNSGSMGWRINQACMAVWAIKRGLERIHANTTVYAFNSGSRLLYSSSDKAEPFSARILNTGGTTNPLMALKESEKIFNMSSRTTKMLFVVTDGGFDHSEPCDNFIKEFNDMGVITSTVFIGYLHKYDVETENIEHYRHHAKYFNVISQPSDIVSIASDIVHGEIGARV